jgi:hypothetical protein
MSGGERKKPGPKPSERGPLAITWPIKSTPEWRDWLKRYAEFRRTTPTSLLDRALTELARRDKFELPPKRI